MTSQNDWGLLVAGEEPTSLPPAANTQPTYGTGLPPARGFATTVSSMNRKSTTAVPLRAEAGSPRSFRASHAGTAASSRVNAPWFHGRPAKRHRGDQDGIDPEAPPPRNLLVAPSLSSWEVTAIELYRDYVRVQGGKAPAAAREQRPAFSDSMLLFRLCQGEVLPRQDEGPQPLTMGPPPMLLQFLLQTGVLFLQKGDGSASEATASQKDTFDFRRAACVAAKWFLCHTYERKRGPLASGGTGLTIPTGLLSCVVVALAQAGRLNPRNAPEWLSIVFTEFLRGETAAHSEAEALFPGTHRRNATEAMWRYGQIVRDAAYALQSVSSHTHAGAWCHFAAYFFIHLVESALKLRGLWEVEENAEKANTSNDFLGDAFLSLAFLTKCHPNWSCETTFCAQDGCQTAELQQQVSYAQRWSILVELAAQRVEKLRRRALHTAILLNHLLT